MKSLSLKSAFSLALIASSMGLSACRQDHPGTWGGHPPRDGKHGGEHGHPDQPRNPN